MTLIFNFFRFASLLGANGEDKEKRSEQSQFERGRQRQQPQVCGECFTATIFLTRTWETASKRRSGKSQVFGRQAVACWKINRKDQ
jgi:hypothetical protein